MLFLKNKAFSLIEVLLAATILGVVVFAIIRLGTNNAHQISLIELEKARSLTEKNITECIESLGYDSLTPFYISASTGSISF